MTPLIIKVASFFNELGATACNAIDRSVIFVHAIFISLGSVIAVGFSPCGPDMASLSFVEAAQNSAYVGFTIPEPACAGTEESVDELLEPPHDAMKSREAMATPVERDRTISFLGICPTCCGDLNG